MHAEPIDGSLTFARNRCYNGRSSIQRSIPLPKQNSASVTKEIRQIRRALSNVDRALQRLGPILLGAAIGKSNGAPRKLNISPRRRAILKLQGAYMGYMRNLDQRKKTRVKALKESKGFRAAISLARRLRQR